MYFLAGVEIDSPDSINLLNASFVARTALISIDELVRTFRDG